ncbi:MAG: hypothetical protein AB7D46_08710 [Flavobacteriaceae bacterium]
MKSKNLFLGLLLLGTTSIFAQEPVVQDSLKVQEFVPATEVELTEEQKNEIAKQAEKQTKELKNKLKSKRKMQKDKPN